MGRFSFVFISLERSYLDGSVTWPPDDSYAWWNRYRASVWNRPLIEMEPRTIAGLLIPAALISSVYNTPEEAKDRLLRRRDVVKPDREISDRYAAKRESYFERWRDVANLYGHD